MKKVLILDNSKALRRCISFVLEQNDFFVLEAQTGLEGLEALDENPVDLVITGVDIPRQDEGRLLKKLQEKKRHKIIPVLVLSSEKEKAALEKKIDSPANGWIVKPFSMDKLMTEVNRVCV